MEYGIEKHRTAGREMPGLEPQPLHYETVTQEADAVGMDGLAESNSGAEATRPTSSA